MTRTVQDRPDGAPITKYGRRYYTEMAEAFELNGPPLEAAVRPATCPRCHSPAIDTLARVITVTTHWRCRGCDHGWSIASETASSNRSW